MSEQRKAVIKNADMSEDMQQDAVDCASQALSKYNIEKKCLDLFSGKLARQKAKDNVALTVLDS
eukprot:scaffold1897_cov236-Chaetoceros_neogracile.AAC.7